MAANDRWTIGTDPGGGEDIGMGSAAGVAIGGGPLAGARGETGVGLASGCPGGDAMRIGSAMRLTTGAAGGWPASWATGANETCWIGGAGSVAELRSVRAERADGRSASKDTVGVGGTFGSADR